MQTSGEGQTCALAGCRNARARAEHLACGELHHLLLMAGRYNAALPNPYQPILDRNQMGLCALPDCSRAPFGGHPWCSRAHYLSWLSSFYASLSPLQICKLPGCTRHVYVVDSDNSPPSEFCGWRHCQKFAMLNGLQQQHQPPSTQREHGHVPPMHAFKHFALHGVAPKSIRVDNEFFTRHPWEVLAGCDSCCVIAQCKFTRRRKNKQRDMVTKDHYHWKQQGPPKEKNGYFRRYFSYRKRKGEMEEADRYPDEIAYTMKEYVMDGVESYSFVKLCKGGRKACKRYKQEDGIGCSQSSVTTMLDSSNCQLVETFNDLAFVDAFLADLPWIDVLP